MKSPKNLKKVFSVFEKNYKPIPLEIYSKDPYKTLVSTILSSRTKDTLTLKVCEEKLFREASDINKLQKLKEEEIEKLIYPVGFYKVKAKHLKKLADIIIKEFKGKVPDTHINLLKLPGVGQKTANLVLNRAFGVPAIAVDTHVHKISNLLGWVKTKNPLKTEDELKKIIPKKYWSKINKLFVSIGQQYGSIKQLEGFLIEKKLISHRV